MEIETDHDLLRSVDQTVKTIERDVKEIKSKTSTLEERVAVLWMDRTIWNWVIRVFVISTPIVAILANIYSR